MHAFAPQTNLRITSSEEFSAALAAAGPGSVLRLAPGVYREPITIARGGEAGRPLRIEAEVPGSVVFSGAVPARDWTLVGPDRWCMPFVIEAEQLLEPHFGYITQPVQVWVGERRLAQAKRVEALVPGSFAYAEGRLWMQLEAGMDPFHESVEVARTATMLTVSADHVWLRGLVVTRCAASVQIGGACFTESHHRIEDCEFSEAAAGIGAHFDGPHNHLRRNRIHHNGQMGFALVASNVVFEENHVHDNDVRGFCSHPEAEWHVWESGGGKVAYARDGLFRANRFINNRNGPGLWFDIDNYRNRIDGNYFSGNGHSSIMMEISWDNVICNNIICDTLEHNYAAAGILVQLSCRTRIYHNLLLRSEGFGVHLRWHVRTRDIHPFEPADQDAFARVHGFRQEDWMAPDGQYPVAENEIRNNVFVDCRRGAIQLDAHPEFTSRNTSDYNLFWNAHNLHPMAGGHRLLEWQELTGLDAHSFYERDMVRGPLFIDAPNGDLRAHPDGPLATLPVARLDAVPTNFAGEPRASQTTLGPL